MLPVDAVVVADAAAVVIVVITEPDDPFAAEVGVMNIVIVAAESASSRKRVGLMDMVEMKRCVDVFEDEGRCEQNACWKWVPNGRI